MKKKLIVILSFAAILLAWCNNSKVTEIDPNTWTSKEWVSAKEVLNQQIEEAQYIQDLQDFISYNILLTTENKPFVSNVSLTANFDERSSIRWWVGYSQEKYAQTHDLENREIQFKVNADQNDAEPFYASWSLSLLYQDNEMYANIHDFGIFMWEDNMVAKMYTLLLDPYKNQWVNLEAHSWWIITLNEQEDVKLQYILWTLKNVLKTQWAEEDSSNFLNGVVELIDSINSHIDLWISTDWLSLQSINSIKYFELKNWIIQRELVWSFQWDYSAFDLNLTASKKWLQVRFYNIKRYDEETNDYINTDSEISLSLEENSKSDYYVRFQSLKWGKIVVDMDWKLKYDDQVKFSWVFTLDPELEQQQRVSWNIDWRINKKSPNGDEIIPELSWQPILLSSILSSL